MKNTILIVGLVLLVALLVVLGPVLVIWALNTLFPILAIPYNIYSWAAVLIMSAFFQTSVKIKK
jgi:hypothetical protein